MKLGFSQQTFKIYSNIMKIHPVEAELFHGDRRIDMMQLIVAFCTFANALKNEGTITGDPYTHTHLREVGVQLSLC